jgi:hypothetical protein
MKKPKMLSTYSDNAMSKGGGDEAWAEAEEDYFVFNKSPSGAMRLST